MPRDGDSTSSLCSLPQYCRWGWKASSNNSSTGSHPTSGETGAQPRERNLLFSSFPCVSSISWTAKLRNGEKKNKVQEFLPLHSQAVGLVSGWQWCPKTEQGAWGYDSQRKKSVWLHATESQYALWGLSSGLIPVYSRELFTSYQAGGIPFSYTLLWLITRLQSHLLSIAHMKASRRWSIDFCWDLNY